MKFIYNFYYYFTLNCPKFQEHNPTKVTNYKSFYNLYKYRDILWLHHTYRLKASLLTKDKQSAINVPDCVILSIKGVRYCYDCAVCANNSQKSVT